VIWDQMMFRAILTFPSIPTISMLWLDSRLGERGGVSASKRAGKAGRQAQVGAQADFKFCTVCMEVCICVQYRYV